MANEIWPNRTYGILGNAGKVRVIDFLGDQSAFAPVRAAILYDTDEVALGTAANPIKISASVGVSAPTVNNTTLTVADTEYSFTIPSGCQMLEFQARTSATIRFAWVTGKVAAPTAPYFTLKANDYYTSPPINMTGQILYLASSSTGTIVEIIAWV